jgi:hypothetical protein
LIGNEGSVRPREDFALEHAGVVLEERILSVRSRPNRMAA